MKTINRPVAEVPDLDWEHRFQEDLPLYMQVSKDGCLLHLSEHHGDASPGAALRIDTTDLEAFHASLLAKRYKYARPGIQEMPWGREMSIGDPFGNKLIFASREHLSPTRLEDETGAS